MLARDKYGAIKREAMIKAIEFADTIEDVCILRDILEEDLVECCLECSTLLSEKEEQYGL